MTESIATLLKNSELFKGFDQEQFQWIIDNVPPTEITLKNREPLYQQGDIADKCWLIKSGKFLVERPSLRNPYRNVDYEVGAITGLHGIVEPGIPRAVTLIADGDVELVEIKGTSFDHLDTETRLILFQNISRILINKLFECRTSLSYWEDYR